MEIVFAAAAWLVLGVLSLVAATCMARAGQAEDINRGYVDDVQRRDHKEPDRAGRVCRAQRHIPGTGQAGLGGDSSDPSRQPRVGGAG